VVIAGGAGTRFWPAGRRVRPKQLLAIAGDATMLAQTLERCAPLAPPERTLVVTNALQRDAVCREASMLPEENVLAEPAMRNTAAAIGLAAERIGLRLQDAVMVVVPSDHVIRPAERFLATFRAAIRRAESADVLLTVGVRPLGPATGYGYIEAGDRVAEVDGRFVHRVLSFKEKPDAARAAEFVASGRYFWNSGAFVWRLQTLREAFRRHLPGHLDTLRAIVAAGDPIDPTRYRSLDGVPIDIGILERADNVEVIPADFEWDDVGSWLAIARLNPRGEGGNVAKGLHVGIDTRNCVVVAPAGHLVATLGVEDLLIIQTPDATFVCPKHRAEDVRKMVRALEERGLDRYL